jgi:hypothetical protein
MSNDFVELLDFNHLICNLTNKKNGQTNLPDRTVYKPEYFLLCRGNHFRFAVCHKLADL